MSPFSTYENLILFFLETYHLCHLFYNEHMITLGIIAECAINETEQRCIAL